MQPAPVNTDPGASLIYVRFDRERATGTEGKLQGGSGVKDGGLGGSPWLHKRSFGSAEAREGPGRPPEGILDAAGDAPPVFASGGRRGVKRPAGPERSVARSHPVGMDAGMPKGRLYTAEPSRSHC